MVFPMNIVKPSTQSIVAAGGMLLALVGTFLTWWSIDRPDGVPAALWNSIEHGAAGVDYAKGVFVLILALLALALFVAGMFLMSFPPNIQMPLMGAPIFQAVLAVPALVLTLVGFLSSGMGLPVGLGMDVDASRGIGLWLTLVGVLVWLVVTAMQAKPLLEAAKAMKAAANEQPAG